MRYRRVLVPGGTYFFTVVLADRSSDLLVAHVDALRDCVREVRLRHPFEIVPWVVLPDHLHAIWSLPEDDADFSTRWSLIKAGFSRRINLLEPLSYRRSARGERQLWQLRFWEHCIRNELDLQRHIDYVHYNPARHGYCVQASEWPYSSIHRAIARGEVNADWAAPKAQIEPSSTGEQPGEQGGHDDAQAGA